MKISWGTIVISVFILFAGMMALMAGISMTRNSDLVSENYYESELKYQDKIDEIKRTRSLEDQIKVDTLRSSVIIKYPQVNTGQNIEGKIKFYRAMDKKKDFEVEIRKNEKNLQEIPTLNLDKGNWKVQVSWIMNGTKYYNESDIYIN